MTFFLPPLLTNPEVYDDRVTNLQKRVGETDGEESSVWKKPERLTGFGDTKSRSLQSGLELQCCTGTGCALPGVSPASLLS